MVYLDSVYTERYMKTPELNPNGYEQSSIHNMTGFRNAKYLLAHGTGDDNGKYSLYKGDFAQLMIYPYSSFPTYCCFS